MKSNQQGSSLIILFVIISILMLYGTILFTAISVSARTKDRTIETYKAYYCAEAGLDEAILITNKVVYNKIQDAHSFVDDLGITNPFLRDFLLKYRFKTNMQYNLTSAIEDTSRYQLFGGNHLSIDLLNYRNQNNTIQYKILATYGGAITKQLSYDVIILGPNYDTDEDIITIENFTMIK